MKNFPAAYRLLWRSIILFDSFFPSVISPWSSLSNRRTRTFLGKWEDRHNNFVMDNFEEFIRQFNKQKLICKMTALLVGRYCSSTSKKTTMTLNSLCHVSRIRRYEYITFNRYNIVKSSHLGCMIGKRFKLFYGCQLFLKTINHR